MKTYSRTTFLKVTDVIHENIMYSQSHFRGVGGVGSGNTMEIFHQDLFQNEYCLLAQAMETFQ